MLELQKIANARGFDAQAVDSSTDVMRLKPGTGYVLHFADDHFVGCFPQDDDTYVVFDPADGRTVRLSAKELDARWTGHALRISLPPAL